MYWSHPTRVRGLKSILICNTNPTIFVAPYTGAWIEIRQVAELVAKGNVAPYTGAWIEIK